jgi:hypothetical protein
MDSEDDTPADFDWLTSQATRQEDAGYWYVPPSGDVWWEVGIVSFSCESYEPDLGEPFEVVATDWQVDGQTLPNALIPKTRGQFRRLCQMANGDLK